MVTISLSILTLAAIGAFVLGGSDILGTIAATGVGALAGAVSNVFKDRDNRPRDVEDKPEDDSDSVP